MVGSIDLHSVRERGSQRRRWRGWARREARRGEVNSLPTVARRGEVNSLPTVARRSSDLLLSFNPGERVLTTTWIFRLLAASRFPPTTLGCRVLSTTWIFRLLVASR